MIIQYVFNGIYPGIAKIFFLSVICCYCICTSLKYAIISEFEFRITAENKNTSLYKLDTDMPESNYNLLEF